MRQQCSKCGNWVEGKKIDTIARKTTRKVVGLARKGGMTATGAAIGSVIPVAGTVVGGAIGFVADILLDDSLNDLTNDIEQTIFDETDYEFNCPKCGHKWIKHSSKQVSQKEPLHSPSLIQHTTAALNSNSSNNLISFRSRGNYCFIFGERHKLSITKYEFASALVEAKLAANVTDALRYYDAMPINLQVQMNEQEVDSAKGILKRKHIPFQLQALQTRNQQTSSNSEPQSTTEEKEQRKFLKCFNDYLDNETEIIENIENAISFIDDVTKQSIVIENDIVKSEFFYLNALCCLFYSKEHPEDSSLCERGDSFIHRALNLLDDEEYRFMALLYRSLLFDNNIPGIAARQRQISDQCPVISKMENCLLKTEYWETVYNDVLHYSLLSSCMILEKKEKYREALQCWELMHRLSDGYSQFIAAYFMFAYHYYNTPGIERNGKLAFKYANEVLSIYDFSENFNSDDLSHQYWQQCLSEIGCMYKEGDGVETNYQKAWEYLSKAVELGGYSDAFIDMADMFEKGLGVPQSNAKAIELYQQAAKLDDEDAIEKLKELQVKSANIGNIVSSLQSANHNNNTQQEQEYVELLKECLEEDNDISPRERRILEKLRVKLGISEIRAKELEEQLLVPQLTEDEQEYLEEYKTCLEEDGEISSKEKRLLEKLRIALGISEERCRTIENQMLQGNY